MICHSVIHTCNQWREWHSRVYINTMVSERIKKEMECQQRMKISRAVRVSSLIRRHRKGYLGNIKFRVKSRSNSNMSHVFVNKRREAHLERGEFLHEVESEVYIKAVETKSQTDFNYMQVHLMIMYNGISTWHTQELSCCAEWVTKW